MSGRSVRKWVSRLLWVGVFGLISLNASAQEGRKVLIHPQPVYPELARGMSLKGTVRLEIAIGTDGEIKNTKVIGGHPILVQAAIEAVKKWKYAPSSTETTTTLEFTFK